MENPVSRRVFLGSTIATAGLWGITRLSEQALAADESTAGPSAPQHPLDPLTPAEISRAVRLVREQKKLPDTVRFASVVLQEPARAEGKTAKEATRRALLVLLDNADGAAFEATADLTSGDIVRYQRLAPGVQPAIMLDEFAECEEAIKRSSQFREALKKRGIDDVNLVMVDPWSAGRYGNEPPEENARRLTRALCWVRSEPHDNGYARPLDGVVVVFDLNKMEVLRVEDYGVVPLPPTSGNWAREYMTQTRPDVKPLAIVQRDGPSFRVDGHEVRWQNWRFHIGFTPREGLVLHDLAFEDGGRPRSVLQRAAICEMVVPYGDPGERYYRKNAFDIGEYGIGTMANSLALGCDCLGTIRYFDAHLANSRGGVRTIKNAICLHEEDDGILWKHTDWRTNQSEVRRSRRLSVSFIATVGNYEYGFYWNLYQDGTIQCQVKLTGVMNTTALRPGEQSAYGVEIAPGLNAPFHQHIFAARLDTNIDGPRNSVYEVNTLGIPPGPDNPHGNAFRAVATLLECEDQAKRSVNGPSARFWRVVNSERKSALGRPVGYRLVPGENCPAFAQPDAAIMQRAGFAAHNLWVTPYRADERFPSGEYPNQAPGGDGLPRWTSADRPIENRELVLWYVFAHNHVPRPEDWPVMPAWNIGFMLKPDGFFDRNPALDLPPSVAE